MISSQPKYTPSSPDRLGGSLLETVGDQTDSNLIATQRIEAAKYGVAATSDGWSSNPKSRPIEAQLFESPTVTHLNACEDLSGTVKSDVNIAKKLGDWSGAGCDSMGLPNTTVDFMAVDGAEIGSVNLLMTGANIDGVKLEPRPWLLGGVCTPHSLDLELEDIAKLGFVEEDIAEVRRRCEVRTECELTDTSCQLTVLPPITFFPSSQKKRAVKFLREHQYSLFLWREHAAKEVLNPGATRFATNFIMPASLITQSDAAKDVVTDRRYMSWLKGEGTKGKRKKSYYNEGVCLKSKFLDDDWWAKGELTLEIVEPIVTRHFVAHG